MKTQATEYTRFITLSDIWRLFANLGLDPNDAEHYVLISGGYKYTNPWSFTLLNGIKVYRNWDDEDPIMLIDTKSQYVYIFDQTIANYFDKDSIYLKINFEQAFSEDFYIK